jgi:DNA damage-inducible protein 1
MLYVPVIVNGYSLKAFVDSGAQTTIMSPACAEACGISHLIDTRFGGIARGVGTARILGRVLQTPIQIGDAELDCAFTVTDQDMDLLFGLDMLKRHQACIDLRSNKLIFPLTEVEFLPESDIPKKDLANMVDEPTVPGPDGTEVGAKTGTVRPQGAAAAAHKSIKDAEKKAEQATAGASAAGASAAASSSSSQPAAAPRFSEADISQIVSLGFSRDEAVQALDATGGNIEFAASLLFQR